MKNYNLGEYMLTTDKIVMFPLTIEELMLLKENRNGFESYFKMPYITANLKNEVLECLINGLNMDDDYWFLNSLWVVVDIKAREIYGTIRYEKCEDINNIITNLTMLSDFPEACDEALNLFAKFLIVNGYKNIVVQTDKTQNEEHLK